MEKIDFSPGLKLSTRAPFKIKSHRELFSLLLDEMLVRKASGESAYICHAISSLEETKEISAMETVSILNTIWLNADLAKIRFNAAEKSDDPRWPWWKGDNRGDRIEFITYIVEYLTRMESNERSSYKSKNHK